MMRKSFKNENGYSVYTEEKQYNHETVFEILRKNENSTIASIEIKKDYVTLKERCWECPFCNYKNELLNYNEMPFADIYDALFYQTSLFETN